MSSQMEFPADFAEWLCSSHRWTGIRGLLGYPKTQSVKNFATLGYRKAQQIGTRENLSDPVKKRNEEKFDLKMMNED